MLNILYFSIQILGIIFFFVICYIPSTKVKEMKKFLPEDKLHSEACESQFMNILCRKGIPQVRPVCSERLCWSGSPANSHVKK